MSDVNNRPQIPTDLSLDQDVDSSNDEFGDALDQELEFDSEGLQLATKEAELQAAEELAKDATEAAAFRSGSITPDGLIDEDFEQELGYTPQVEADDDGEFSDVARYRIIEVAGDDLSGRKVIIFSACKLPSNKTLDHQRLLEYIKHTLDQYVESDYSLVYFHYGLSSRNKPKLSWLLQAYREFDRKYKKNMKALYLVHPTNFIKLLWKLFSPIISVKFGRKVRYMNYLHELREHLHFDQLSVPPPVLEYDTKLIKTNKPHLPAPASQSEFHAPLQYQQFGVTLQRIKENCGGSTIPPVIEQCVEFLRNNALETEGIFRRSAGAGILKTIVSQINLGERVDFENGDIHIPAVLIKKFLRELQEPVLTFNLFEPIIRLHMLPRDQKLLELKGMLQEDLPEDNYQILKYIMQFLTEVVKNSEKNKMGAQNLSIVFGPNLLWPQGQASLMTMGYINMIPLLMLENYEELFVR